MSAEEILLQNEDVATEHNQFVSHVSGKSNFSYKEKNFFQKFGAAGLLTVGLIVVAIMFSSGNVIPSAISQRLVEETDVQYADAVVSKELVFQQALKNGEVPQNTAEILKRNGVLVGYSDGDSFVETSTADRELELKINNKIIKADDFVTEVSENVSLYDAFNEATYSRAAYYYDDAAQKVFKKIGTNRNNYNNTKSFEEVMDEMMGEGSNIDINSVSLVAKTRINEETGEEETYYDYESNGEDATINNGSTDYIDMVSNKNNAETKTQATLESANSLKVADTISKEQRSSLFYLLIMENISKMMAGDGNTARINEAMNYLHRNSETEVVDVNTGEIIKVTGSPLDSPSLYSVLAESKMEADKAANYSSDRILKLSENKLNNNSSTDIIINTVSSASEKKGSVGRLSSSGSEVGDIEILRLSTPIIDSSLKNNSFKTITGINAGEFLVEGAVNVGKELAKQSGASAGDADAVLAYSRLNNTVLAMDAAAERAKKNPFDVTSKNTFLGSIVYNLAMSNYSSQKQSLIMTDINTIVATTKKSLVALMPGVYADSVNNYMNTFGDCETYGSINAVGTATCSEIATFDTSTLNDPFNNAEFVSFVENNTELKSNGKRVIKNDSVLADYIIYNNERITPLGVIDGGILDSLSKDKNSVSFVSNILEMIKTFTGASQESKSIASGEAFVNSGSNSNWQKYKYAQRYVSLARATDVLRQYADNSTAYNNIMFFEGGENPVTAFLDNYYNVANQ
ncbi:hypothetical protein IKF32_01000 [Candidatus Saccharibacteria bacterium]|nr:hypothetical protein [Candidatus Saccharibacteria bacterium]